MHIYIVLQSSASTADVTQLAVHARQRSGCELVRMVVRHSHDVSCRILDVSAMFESKRDVFGVELHGTIAHV